MANSKGYSQVDRPTKQTEILRRVLADGLSEKSFLNIYELGTLQRVTAGQCLFREGDRNESLFLVVKGKFKSRHEAQEQFQRDFIFQEGDWIAEILFLQTPLRWATVVAMTPSIVLTLDGKAFRALDGENRDFIMKKITDNLSKRLNRANKELIKTRGTASHLTRYVLKLREHHENKYEKSEIIQNILKNIPKLPIYVTKLIQLLLDEGASVKDITSLAKEDPSLVSQILKVVNSPYYSLKNKIADLNHAILYLGFNEVYQIIVSGGIQKTMPGTADFRDLHQHSVLISHLAFEICQHYDKRYSSTMSTIGVLHDIGKSIILLLQKQNPKWALFIEMLQPARIGALLLKEWQIPTMVCEAIQYQDYPEFSSAEKVPTNQREFIAILALAHLCCDFCQGKRIEASEHPYIMEYLDILGLKGVTVQEFFGRVIIPSLQKKCDTLPSNLRSMVLSLPEDQPAW